MLLLLLNLEANFLDIPINDTNMSILTFFDIYSLSNCSIQLSLWTPTKRVKLI